MIPIRRQRDTLRLVSQRGSAGSTPDARHMPSPIDRLNELPPLPQRVPAPRRTGGYVLVVVTLVLVANAIGGERGVGAQFRANQEHDELQHTIDRLRDENRQLHGYMRALSSQPRFLEELARRELGMIRPGEQLFVIKTTTDAPSPPTESAEHLLASR